MARAGWNTVRLKSQRAVFDYYKESLEIRSGAQSVSLFGILDTSQDLEVRAKSPDGTFPVLARLSCWRNELGFLPVANEALRIARTAKPEEEQLYLVVSVDSTSDLFVIELQANSSNANPFFQ